MNEPLRIFQQVMLLSGITCVCLGFLFLLMTKWRPLLRRCLDAEGSFWKRLGMPERWTFSLRRLEESRTLTVLVGAMFALHLLLLILAAGAHAYYAPRLQKKALHEAKGRPPVVQKKTTLKSRSSGQRKI